MNPTALTRYLAAVVNDDTMLDELTALAAKHGFDLTELPDHALGSVFGGAGVYSRSNTTGLTANQDQVVEAAVSPVEQAREQAKQAVRTLLATSALGQQAATTTRTV